MLVLTRRVGEVIQIGENVCLKVVAVEGKRVRLAIDAPIAVNIRRGEIVARQDPAGNQAASSAEAKSTPTPVPTSATILFVDNEPSIRQYCKEEFEREGFRVLLAADGEQAMSVLHSTAVDIAVLDEHMPRWSGLETAEQIRRYDPSIHIILFTADPSYRSYQSSWIDKTVLKAADPSDLKAAVTQGLKSGAK